VPKISEKDAQMPLYCLFVKNWYRVVILPKHIINEHDEQNHSQQEFHEKTAVIITCVICFVRRTTHFFSVLNFYKNRNNQLDQLKFGHAKVTINFKFQRFQMPKMPLKRRKMTFILMGPFEKLYFG
jgi:hypothetical protein